MVIRREPEAIHIKADTQRWPAAGQCVLSAPDRFKRSDECAFLDPEARVGGAAEEARLRDTVVLRPSQAFAPEVCACR